MNFLKSLDASNLRPGEQSLSEVIPPLLDPALMLIIEPYMN